MDVPTQTVVDILQFFMLQVENACNTGQTSFDFDTLASGSGSITKVSIKNPCSVAADFQNHIDMVKAGKLRFTQ